jgi:para-nitrobenzyl esterase
MMRTSVFLAAIVLSRAASGLVVADPEGLVQTPLGPVQGLVNPRARVFLGMPYAAPPIGALRWKPTQKVAAWGPSVLQAVNDPPGCPQNCTLPPHTCPATMSESCLFLSVYTPRLGNFSQPAPVLLFIHGRNRIVCAAAGDSVCHGKWMRARCLQAATSYRAQGAG